MSLAERECVEGGHDARFGGGNNTAVVSAVGTGFGEAAFTRCGDRMDAGDRKRLSMWT